MATKIPTSKAPQPSILSPDDEGADPHIRALAAAVEQLRIKRGLSKNKLAAAAGIHGTHMGQFLLGRQGISLEVLAKAAEALGAILLTEGDEKRPTRIGTITPAGLLMTDLKTIALPGFIEVPEGCDDLVAGEEVFLRASHAYEPGKWVLVERLNDSTRHFLKCVDLDGGKPFLRTPQGDEWRYMPDRYRVVAQAYGGFRPM